VRYVLLLLCAAAIGCGKQEARPPESRPAAPAATVTEPPTVPRTEVGDMMPGYAAPYLADASTFRLEGEKGSVVFVNVWATWCGPCRAEIPELQRLHDKYGQQGFKVVGISIDDGSPDDVKTYVKEAKITYPIVLDQQSHIANVLQTTQLPTSVILDKSGRIVWRKVGAVTPNEISGVEAVIAKALKG